MQNNQNHFKWSFSRFHNSIFLESKILKDKLALEASLSDAIDLTGPIRPLSGKIILIRYEADGTAKEKILYSARGQKGSARNPFVKRRFDSC